jgi:isopentenyl-diphosphate delta-isomerase
MLLQLIYFYPMEEVILVNELDEVIGSMEKMEAHRKGILHRAFSVFIFNRKGQLLLQKRAAHKYHSAGLWSNTCCSHPRPEETIEAAAGRRLMEEMGMQCDLNIAGSLIYKAELDKGLTEHEYDYILKGITDELPQINTEEVSNYKYVSMKELKEDMQLNPGQFTFWLHQIAAKNFF